MIDFLSDVCLSFVILMPVHLCLRPSASMLKELNPVMFYIKHQAHVLTEISLFKQRNFAFDFSPLSYEHKS